MNKKLIRLTESDLHRIVKKSVNKIMKEAFDVSRFGDDTLEQIDNMRFTDAQKMILNYALELEERGFSDEEYYELAFFFAEHNGLNESKRIKKKLIKESANSWMGCQRIKMIWHGEWSDPELEYNGSVANYWDVENWCAEACREEGVNPNDKNAFANWIRQNEDRVGMTIQEMSNDF